MEFQRGLSQNLKFTIKAVNTSNIQDDVAVGWLSFMAISPLRQDRLQSPWSRGTPMGFTNSYNLTIVEDKQSVGNIDQRIEDVLDDQNGCALLRIDLAHHR